MHNIAGTLEMEECGVNTEWLKDLIIEKAQQVYHPSVVSELDNIIQLFSRIVELINKLGDAMKDLHINKIPRLNTFIVKR